MFIWYVLFIILGVVVVVSDKYDFWDNLLIGTIIWLPFVLIGLFLSMWVSEGQTEIVKTNTYTLCDFSDYYVNYDEGTYLVIEDNGDLILRYEFEEEEVEEKTFSSYKIEFTTDEEKTYTVTSYLEDVKSPILRHLFWNSNGYKNIIKVPENTSLIYKK